MICFSLQKKSKQILACEIEKNDLRKELYLLKNKAYNLRNFSTFAAILKILNPQCIAIIVRTPPGCNGYVCDEEMATKVVLITGSSSGIGLATAVLLAYDTEKRFKVYATMRNLAKKQQLETEGKDFLGDTLIVKQLDVCEDDSVNKAVKDVIEQEGRIDVLSE